MKNRLERIETRLETLGRNQHELLKLMRTSIANQKAITEQENKEITEEKELEAIEHEEIDEIHKIEALERSLKNEVRKHPLRRITYKDATKAAIGAFAGIVGHFAFMEGAHMSETLSMFRATLLLVISFLITMGILYYSGFRKVRQMKFMSLIPLRVVVVYGISLAVIVLVLVMFNFVGPHSEFGEVYKAVASISVLASIGAGTADLIGEN